MTPLEIGIVSAVIGSVVIIVAGWLALPIGKVRPLRISKAELTSSSGGLDLKVTIFNRRFRVAQELTGLLILDLPKGWHRRSRRWRNPHKWIRKLPEQRPSFQLKGADMGGILTHQHTVEARGDIVVRGVICDLKGKPFPLEKFDRNLEVVVYPAKGAPAASSISILEVRPAPVPNP